MTLKSPKQDLEYPTAQGAMPTLHVRRIGIVSRNYGLGFPNGRRDFSYVFRDALRYLDDEGCDAVLFSLFSLETLPSLGQFKNLRNIRTVFLEEFRDGRRRDAVRFMVFHYSKHAWQKYSFRQCFGSLSDVHDREVEEFVEKELPARIMGNVCVLLCGESNGVNYSPTSKRVEDFYKLRSSIPPQVEVVLNPVHDRMTRFEMEKKRQFLSRPDRLLVSVWNKGKLFKNHKTGQSKTRNEPSPAWSVFRKGRRLEVKSIPNELGVEIGVVELS